MVDARSKEIIKLRQRMDKLLLAQLHSGLRIIWSIAENNEIWLTNGFVAVMYDVDNIVFAQDNAFDDNQLQSIINIGKKFADSENAYIDYYKGAGSKFSAILKDRTGNKLQINYDYYKLFGDKFNYKLYVPVDGNKNTPVVFVYYFNDFVGLILPISKSKKDLEELDDSKSNEQAN